MVKGVGGPNQPVMPQNTNATNQTPTNAPQTPTQPVAPQAPIPGAQPQQPVSGQAWGNFLGYGTGMPPISINVTGGGSSQANSVVRQQIQNGLGMGWVQPGRTYNYGSYQTTGNMILDSQLDAMVDNMLFNPREGMGLPTQNIQGGFHLGLGADAAAGSLAQNPYSYDSPLLHSYGMRGQTLAEVGGAVVNKGGYFYQPTPMGNFYANGQVTALAARARAYGGIDPYSMAAEFGVEADLTLLEARGSIGMEQNMVNLGFLQAGQRVQVDGRLYAGAQAWADARISLANGPRAKISAGAFAGASAELAMSDEFVVNGRAIAGMQGAVKAWAGAGAKLEVDVGFENGKLNCRFDIGAALGVGIEIDFGFSIDFKAMADTVKDIVKGVVGTVLNIFTGGLFGSMGGGVDPMAARLEMMRFQQLLAAMAGKDPYEAVDMSDAFLPMPDQQQTPPIQQPPPTTQTPPTTQAPPSPTQQNPV